MLKLGFKEMWSARVFGNIHLSTTGQMSLVFTLYRIVRRVAVCSMDYVVLNCVSPRFCNCLL